jgi:CPA2 family monovalent cation:H+ antiporter-2
MSAELHLLTNVAVAVAIALAGGLLAHRLGQSVIIGYLLAGVVIGPFTPGFIGDHAQMTALAEVGIVFLMFALGIEFSLKQLAAMRGVAIVGTLIQVALTIVAGLALGAAVGWPLAQSIFFGGIIAISSTMVILKTLIDRGEVSSHHGRVLLGMLIVQDLAAVLLIVVLPELTQGGAALGEGVLTLAKAAAFIGATLVLGTRVVPRFMARIEGLGSAELFVLTAAALALGSAAVGGLLGLSPALGAFLAGLLLTETEFDHRVIAEVVPMRDLFATLFFVSVGMLIDPWFVANNLPAVLGLAAFIMVVKAVVTLGVVLPFGLGSKTAVFTALGMSQVGEFSYLLAHAGREAGAISESLNTLVLTSSLVTIALTPAAFWVAPRVDLALARIPGLGRYFRPRSTVLAGDRILAQHAIVVGFGRVGRRVAAGLRAADVPVTVIEDDLHLVHEIRQLGYDAVYGDASYKVIMDAAHAERARLVVTALPDAGATRAVVLNARRANPQVPILARVAHEEYDARVRQAGATAIVAPERAGALMLLEEGARALGLTPALLTRALGSANLESALATHATDVPDAEDRAFGSSRRPVQAPSTPDPTV